MTAVAFDSLKDIASADVAEKRVLIRTDLNVPMADGQISDATRIERLLPTFRVLASRGAKIVILSHLGRPDGEPVAKYSLKPVADKLAAMLGATVAFADDCVGPVAEAVVNALEPGQIAMLENVRFHKEEEDNDPVFAAELAKLGDIYVNDAFSVSHRAHASTEAVAHLLPAYAGPSLLAEIGAFKVALDHPERPVAAIVGGSKVSTKIAVLGNLAQKMDYLFIGGGMANTFLYADGVAVGKSLCEPNAIDTVKEIRAKAEAAGCKIVLPVDAVVAREFKANAETEVVPVGEVPADAMILDIGPRSVAEFTGLIEGCKTLLWNGPVGAFEIPPFGEGTFALAREAAALTQAGKIVTIAGGGDTVAALNAASVTDKFTYVSTAGGAFLEWLEGRTLPGVAALIR
ncbi:phosphoglycerate kinase [Rhodomicrobium vannielii ATCC 17100]|uniref:phosphoglycerate kinase n=1 Tax=Rhodomicrobium vannielii TaxID=1069 RepID=UPI001917D6E6|nr:phosphoglycerate kinase [Rhodomicrobium vannielii]MBJ7534276.1 phosphoglycerate kinase [Rhodomicrobium vannielii ATCC 17100]